MAQGINFFSNVMNEGYVHTPRKCVFISYQHADYAECKVIADYFMSKGINVFFDRKDIPVEHTPEELVNIILKGVRSSTHMLCVVSSKTLNSLWVPWEIGCAYAYQDVKSTPKLALLTLKGITNTQLPDYMRIVDRVRNYKDLFDYADRVCQENTGNRVRRTFSDTQRFANILDD